MTTLSQMVDCLIQRAHAGVIPGANNPAAHHDKVVLGLGTKHDQVLHNDPAGIDGSAINRLIDSTLSTLAGDHLHESYFTQPQQQAIFVLKLTRLILVWIRQQDSLAAALQLLRNHGMEAQVQSWQGRGINERIMPDMLNDIFSQAQIERLAQQCSVKLDTVRTGLATILPQVIDQLTADSQQSEGTMHAETEINNLLARLVSL